MKKSTEYTFFKRLKLQKVICGIVLLGFCNACDVERLPETQISDAQYWRSENDLLTATNYLYTFLPGFPVLSSGIVNGEDFWGDEAYAVAANPVSDGSRLAPATAADYTDPYKLIATANNIVENAPRASASVTPTVLERYIGEARFFRAFAYFLLLQKYGDVPLILKVLQQNSPELTEAKRPRTDIIEQIYQDLEYAVQKLPTPTTLGTAGYGRISQTAALAFRARVGLFEGTRSKYHSYGDPIKHLTIAYTSAKAVIDSKQHDLFSDYYNLFQIAGESRQNRENILVKQYGASNADRILTHNLSNDLVNNYSLTKSLGDSYLMTDGLPTAKSPLYKIPTTTLEVFQNRDTRFSATVFKRGDVFQGGALFNVSALSSHRTGFGIRKFFNVDDATTQAAVVDRPLIRYAEVLLIYAEAAYELNGQISDADLDLTVNRLRQRGGVAKLTNAFAEKNGLTIRDEIRRERRTELAFEGFRYWDLIRWKTAETELVKPILGNYFFRAEYANTVNPLLDANGYILVQAANFRRFDPKKDYLWPFPTNELALNPALVQNPGW